MIHYCSVCDQEGVPMDGSWGDIVRHARFEHPHTNPYDVPRSVREDLATW